MKLRDVIPSHYRWAQSGDLNAFFGLMLDNMSDLVITAGLLMGVFAMPADVVLGRMIPGTAVAVLVGDLFYTWMAWRLAARTGKGDVCAMPLGIDTPSTFVFCLGIIGPVFVDAHQRGMSAADAAMLAWEAGMAIIVITGLVKVAVSYAGRSVRKWIPRAGLLGSIAGIAVALIAFFPSLEVFASPVAGFLSLGIILVAVIGGRALPKRLPGAFGAVVVGGVAFYLLVMTGTQHGKTWAEIVAASHFGFAFPVPTVDFVRGVPTAIGYLPLAVPWALVTVVGGIDCTESAAAAGDDYDTRTILLVEGVSTVIGGLCGGVLQTTPYIGHPAYKRMGGRAAYTLATALFIGLGGVFGYLGFLVDLIPAAATAPILIFVGLEITAQAFVATPPRHAPAVVLAFVPSLAYLVVTELGQFVPNPSSIPTNLTGTYGTLIVMANGFILTAMVWAGGAAFLTDRRYSASALTFLAGAVCSAFGIMHSPFRSGEMFLPWHLSGKDLHTAATMTAAYGVLAIAVWAMRWLPKEREPVQLAG